MTVYELQYVSNILLADVTWCDQAENLETNPEMYWVNIRWKGTITTYCNTITTVSNHCGSKSFPDVLGQPPQYGRGLCPCSIFPSNNGEHRYISCISSTNLAAGSSSIWHRCRRWILRGLGKGFWKTAGNGFGSGNEERDPQKVSKHAVFTESSTNFSGRSSRGAPSATSISAQEIAMFILIYPDWLLLDFQCTDHDIYHDNPLSEETAATAELLFWSLSRSPSHWGSQAPNNCKGWSGWRPRPGMRLAAANGL